MWYADTVGLKKSAAVSANFSSALPSKVKLSPNSAAAKAQLPESA
jgi:hypothetical protein